MVGILRQQRLDVIREHRPDGMELVLSDPRVGTTSSGKGLRHGTWVSLPGLCVLLLCILRASLRGWSLGVWIVGAILRAFGLSLF